jgi:hypothetical protein
MQQAQAKWLSQARIEIYLGMSPRHSKSVVLVLNPHTGLVSPQFHVKFNDDFETVGDEMEASHGHWKGLVGFISYQTRSQLSPTRRNATMVKNLSNAQLNNLLDDRPASILTGKLLPALSEGDEFPTDPTMDEEFATSSPEFFNSNMEFGTRVNDAPIAD